MIVYFISILDLPTAYRYASISPLSVNFTFLHTLNFYFLNILNFLLCQCSNVNQPMFEGRERYAKESIVFRCCYCMYCFNILVPPPPPPPPPPPRGGGWGGGGVYASASVCCFPGAQPPPPPQCIFRPPAKLYLCVVGDFSSLATL